MGVVVVSVELDLTGLGLVRPVAAQVVIRPGEDRAAVDSDGDGVAPAVWLFENSHIGRQDDIHRPNESLQLEFGGNTTLCQRHQAR